VKKILCRHEEESQANSQALQSINEKLVNLEHVVGGSVANAVELIHVQIRRIYALEVECHQMRALVHPQQVEYFSRASNNLDFVNSNQQASKEEETWYQNP